MATATVEFIEKLPKVELHVHIEGTLTPQLRLKLAKKHSISLKWTTEDEIIKEYAQIFDDSLHDRITNGSLSFFDLYYGSMDVLLTEDDFYELAMGYFRRAVAQNTRYSEIFFDPQAHTRRGVKLETLMNGLKRAQLEAEEKLGFHCRWIMCLLRDESVESGRATYEACIKYRDMIHGIGLDSYEMGRSAMLFDDIYKRAKADGFHLTAHCDVNMPETHKHILECATKLSGDGLARIDHGLNAAQKPELIQIIREKGIGLTCCPWGSYGYLFHAGEEKLLFIDMIRKLFDEGVILTINSDDPAYFGMNWVQESLILVAEQCKFTMEEMAVLVQNAVMISWAPEELKTAIMEEIKSVLTAYTH